MLIYIPPVANTQEDIYHIFLLPHKKMNLMFFPDILLVTVLAIVI